MRNAGAARVAKLCLHCCTRFRNDARRCCQHPLPILPRVWWAQKPLSQQSILTLALWRRWWASCVDCVAYYVAYYVASYVAFPLPPSPPYTTPYHGKTAYHGGNVDLVQLLW